MANQNFMRKIELGDIHINKNDERIPLTEEAVISDPDVSVEVIAEPLPVQKIVVSSALSQTEQKILRFTCAKAMDGLFESFQSEIYTDSFIKRLANQYKEGLLPYDNPHLVTLIHECVERELVIDFLGDMTAEVLLYIIHE